MASFLEGFVSTDYEGRCGNCHEFMDDDMKYCPHCGTKRGEGEFKPYFNDMRILYGPPVKSWYVCKKCGHKWTTLICEEGQYCPECGQMSAEKTSEWASWDWI